MDLFQPDKPVDFENEDQFQRYHFARKIAEMVAAGKRSTSLVVGVYGKWGEGKTSVMNFCRAELDKKDEVVVINFNPWLFNDERHLLKSFFENFADKLNTRLTTKRKVIATTLASYAGAIGSVVDLFGTGGFAGLAGNTISKLVAAYKNESIEKLKEKIDELIISANCNFVVFVDDIDRLDVNEIQAVFKLIKLIADFPRTSYVLSFDDVMVAAALGPKYSTGDTKAGSEFLEKIVQVPLRLPQASKYALQQYTLTLLTKVLEHYKVEMPEKEAKFFRENFEQIFMPQINKPRIGVRYANAVAFTLPLVQGELNTGDLLIVEGIKLFYPEFYQFMAAHPEVFLLYNKGNDARNLNERRKNEITEQANRYSAEGAELILELLPDLFPQLGQIFSNKFLRDNYYEALHREKRIASSSHFARYFSYTVPEGEISDVYFNQLLARVAVEPIDEITNAFREALQTINPGSLIFKLRLWEKEITGENAIRLAVALAPLGSLASKTDDLFSMSSFGQLARFISGLVRNLPNEEMVDAGKQIADASEPFELAIEVGNDLRIKNNNRFNGDKITTDEIGKVRMHVVDRFKVYLPNNGFFGVVDDDVLTTIFYWWYCEADVEELRMMLKAEIDDDHSRALRLIKCFVPTIHSYSSSGQSDIFKARFTVEKFAEINIVADTDYLYEILTREYGQLQDTSTGSGRDAMTDNDIIAVFQNYNEQVRAGSLALPIVWDKMTGYYF